MIQDIIKGLQKRKVKLFLLFVLCSFSAWFLSNLSESYTSTAKFDLNFMNIPEDRMLIQASLEKLDVKMEAVGFQFLRFNLDNKTIDINLSNTTKAGGKYFITQNQYQKQVENQLAKSMKLVQILQDTIFFDFQEVITKEVAVEAVMSLGFQQNHLLDGAVSVTPATITVTGPVNEIDTIKTVKTVTVEFQDLNSDFDKKVFISKSDSLLNTKFSARSVTVSGKVTKFSEKLMEVPVQVINLPDEMSIRLFPDKVKVLCKAKVGDLKKLSTDNLTVVADFRSVAKKIGTNVLPLTLKNTPKNIYSADLVVSQVEFILKRE